MQPGQACGPDELVAGDDALRERRWPRRVLVAGAVVAAALVLRPELTFEPRDDGSPTVRESPSATNTLAGVAWPARGDLVGDEEFVAAALQRVRDDRPEVTRLYFAGRLTDGSRLVLAGTDVNRGVVATSVHALYVPRGATLGAAQVTEASTLVDPAQVLAWAARGTDGSVRAVVLARPGPVRFELSARVEFSPRDGTARRQWVPVVAEDGVVVADLGPDADPVVTVRATGPGVFVLPLVVAVSPRVWTSRDALAVAGVDAAGYQGPDTAALADALRQQAGLVADLDASRLEVLWSGDPWRRNRLALVLVTRPDGRRLQALVGQQGKTAFPAGVRALADAEPRELPWLLEPFSAQDPTLLLCPTGDGTARYRPVGEPARTLEVGPDGVLALAEPAPSPPSASGAEVTLHDRDGRVLVTATLPAPGFDDPLALD